MERQITGREGRFFYQWVCGWSLGLSDVRVEMTDNNLDGGACGCQSSIGSERLRLF